MKYLLSEEEYNNLVPRRKLESYEQAIEILRDTVVAGRCINDDEQPGIERWTDCSQCPIGKIKHDPDTHPSWLPIQELMCPLPREYPERKGA